ncbi:MAG: sensor histidine kinase [Bryobacteraceae bacterium]
MRESGISGSETGARGPSRRLALCGGFGVILVLLVLSTVEAYRIQEAAGEYHAEIYRNYIDRDEALSRLRRNVLLSSNHVRDFFLSTREDRVAVLTAELRSLKQQNSEALAQLERLEKPARVHVSPRRLVEEYWRVVEPVPEKSALTASAAYDFVQREIVPRRTAAYSSLRQLTQVYQAELQNDEVEYARDRQTTVRRLAMVLGFCVVLGLFVTWLTLRYTDNLERETQRQYSEVARAKGDLRELSAKLLEIQEEERRRLSRGLHDELGQTLTALRIEVSHALSRAATAEVRERLERARALAERCVQTVRDISLVLRPALLDDLGLAPALQWQVEDFGRRSGITGEFIEEGVQERLPDVVKTCVYRVVQEALNNCEKHSGASKAFVSVRQAAGRLSVEVRDDGRGFEVDRNNMPARGEGLGLLGMRERAARLGGSLAIESAPGRGVRVLLEVPVAETVASKGAGA